MKTNCYNVRAATFASALLIQAALLWPANSVGQQGFEFNNRIPGVVIAPIYGLDPDPGDCRHGNTPGGYPPGTQVYRAPLLQGPGYTATLWAGPDGVSEESMVQLMPPTAFRGATAPGYIVPVTVTLPPIAPPGSAIALQMRVWDNRGGTVITWDDARLTPGLPRGHSLSWTYVLPTVEPSLINPMAGLSSFNLCAESTTPVIVTQPVSQCVTPGAPVALSVVAAGSPPLSYQWSLNGTPIANATNATYSIASAGSADTGAYVVTVSNLVASTNSLPATVCLLNLAVCAVITLEGPTGTPYRVEYTPEIAVSPTWTLLTNLTLTTSPCHVIDWTSPQAPRRYYRVLPGTP